MANVKAQGPPSVGVKESGELVVVIPLRGRPDHVWASLFEDLVGESGESLPMPGAEVTIHRDGMSWHIGVTTPPGATGEALHRLLDWVMATLVETNRRDEGLEQSRIRLEEQVGEWWWRMASDHR